jgi:hypothetical protein
MWWDKTGAAEYEFPKGSGMNSFFAGSIWIGGKTESDSLRVAAVKYTANGAEFYNGPLTNQGTVDPSTCAQFDDVFWVRKSEIDLFLADGTISANLLNWPAKSNPHNNMPNMILAPFVDANSDGIYNPEDGDYPAIKGDEAFYTIFNDVGGLHNESGSDPIGIEVHQMTYAYATNDVINNSIFYDYTIIKKTPGNLVDTYFGQFVDPDLGNPQDDFTASSSSNQIGIVLNGDAFDEAGGSSMGYGGNIPASAVKFLATPKDVNGQMMPMSSFSSFNNHQGATGDPQTAPEYYNVLQGKWRDGEDMVLGGNGRAVNSPVGAPVYKYMYDIDAPQPWTECSAGNVPSDRRFVMSVGTFTLEPNVPVQISSVSYSLYPDDTLSFTCDDLDQVIDAGSFLQQHYDNNPLPDTTIVGIYDRVANSLQVGLYPNPSAGSFSIHAETNEALDVEIIDLSGRTIASWTDITPNQELHLDNAGVYIVRVNQNDKQFVGRLVIH